MGGCKVCAWDFRPGAEAPVPVGERWAQRRRAGRRWWNRLRNRRELGKTPTLSYSDTPLAEMPIQEVPFADSDLDKNMSAEDKPAMFARAGSTPGYVSTNNVTAPPVTRYRSHQEVISTVQSLHDTIQLAPVSSRSSRNRVIIPGREYDVPEDAVPKLRDSEEQGQRERPNAARRLPQPEKGVVIQIPTDGDPPHESEPDQSASAPWYRSPLSILKLTLTPPSISLFLALPISLVQPLKALFVSVENWTGSRIPNSPDGRPPLSWVLDVSSLMCICQSEPDLTLSPVDGRFSGTNLHPAGSHPAGCLLCASETAQAAFEASHRRYRGKQTRTLFSGPDGQLIH